MMLRSSRELLGYRLQATDGKIGRVKDFLFDHDTWTIRYLVADTGNWLPGLKVLISPISLQQPDWDSRLFPVRLTTEEVKDAPGLEFDQPVSREYEARWFTAYRWPFYWHGDGLWGDGAMPTALFEQRPVPDDAPQSEEQENKLRSLDEVTGYKVQATDGDVGEVDDFILEDDTWKLRYLVVDTGTWLSGRKVLIAPEWTKEIAWENRIIGLDLSREIIEDSPEYDPATPVNRDYESRLYDYYGRPVYWR